MTYDDWGDRLRECPRCGAAGFMMTQRLANGDRFFVFCLNPECLMQVQPYRFRTPEEAAEHWNMRFERTASRRLVSGGGHAPDVWECSECRSGVQAYDTYCAKCGARLTDDKER